MPDWVWSPLRWALVAAAFSPIALALAGRLSKGSSSPA